MTRIVDFPQHEISLVVDGYEIKGWKSYEISSSMLEPADHFSVSMPFDRDTWDLCRTDLPVRVLVDGTPIVTGYIAERLVPESDEIVQIVGVDKVGRGLVKNCAASVDFSGLGIQQLAQKVASPWFPKVSLSNARNRTVIRGKGRKAKAGSEPLKLATTKGLGTHIQPGMTRWNVIETLCEQAGYLAWSSADGQELIIGEPNYDQEVQYRFFQPAKDSARFAESTALGIGVHESVHDRYSRVIIVGSGTGTDANYGAAVASRYGQAKNNPATPNGDGIDFTAPKILIQQRAVQSAKEAGELAQREMDRRDGLGSTITVRAPGHGQVIAGAYMTLFAPDTLASVEDERTGTKGTYLITSCTYRSSRDTGEETTMSLVRKGTRLIA